MPEAKTRPNISAKAKPASKPAPTSGRPTGVSVIAVIGIIWAILSVIGGIAMIAISPLLGAFLGVGALGGVAAAIGGIYIIFGLILLYGFFKVWNMQKAGWTIVMVLEILSLIMSIVWLSILGIIIPLIIVVYLWMKKDLFR